MNKKAGERINDQTAEVIEIGDEDIYIVKYLRIVYRFSENINNTHTTMAVSMSYIRYLNSNFLLFIDPYLSIILKRFRLSMRILLNFALVLQLYSV